MNSLHYEWRNIGSDDVIEVTLDHHANVRLMDDANFQRYQRGEEYEFKGGDPPKSPALISPPLRGHWHLIVDLQGYVGTVNVGVRKY